MKIEQTNDPVIVVAVPSPSGRNSKDVDQLHGLLKRQLKRHFGDQFEIPAQWRPFIDQVNDAYLEFDSDREILEHSLNLSSQELLDANSKMRAVFQVLPDLVLRLDHQGTVLAIKAGSSSDMMIKREVLIGKRVQNCPIKEVARAFSAAIGQVIAKNSPVSIEYSAVLRGQESHYEARLVPLPKKQMAVVIRNVTDRKQSLHLLESAVEQSSESIVISEARLDWPGARFLFVNPAFTRMTGYTAAETLGQTPRLLQGPNSDRAELRLMRDTLIQGQPYAGETIAYRKDGTEFQMERHVVPIRNSIGTITHFLAIQRDITARKQAEVALRESNEKFHQLAENITDVFWIRSPDMREVQYLSPAFERIWGRSRESLYANPQLWAEAILPQDRDRVRAAFVTLMGAAPTISVEYRIAQPAGEVRWVHARGFQVLDAQDKLIRLMGVVTDITERKRAEHALRESEEHFRFLHDMAKAAYTLADPQEIKKVTARMLGQQLHASRCAYAEVDKDGEQATVLHDYTDGCASTLGQYQLSHLGAKALAKLRAGQTVIIRNVDRELLPGEGADMFNAIGIKALITCPLIKDGGLRAFMSVSQATTRDWTPGEVVLVQDVVERCWAAFERRTAQQRLLLLTNVINASPDFIIVKDRNLRTILCNETLSRAIGKQPEELYGKTDIENGWPYEQVKGNPSKSIRGFEADDREALAGKTIRNPSDPANVGNEVFYFDTLKVPLRDTEGTIIGVLGISRDVTKRRRAEEEREKLDALIQNSADFIGMATLKGKPFYLNRAGRELVGLEPDQDVSCITLAELFDDDTAALLKNTAIPASFAVGQWTGEGKLRHLTTRALVPVHIHSFLVRDSKTHEPICLATVQRNISDIKDSEHKLELTNRELVKVSRQAGMAEIAANVLHNVGNVLNSVNASAELVSSTLRSSRARGLTQATRLMDEHAADLGDFLTLDEKGRLLPGYLKGIAQALAQEQQGMVAELAHLSQSIDHIKSVVASQQSHAVGSGLIEPVQICELAEEALRMSGDSLARHRVTVVREFAQIPVARVDRARVLQILVNLISNAKNAMEEMPAPRRLTLRVHLAAGSRLRIQVTDDGEGIPAQNLTRIFVHGFTTRKSGHGFGLHSCALAARQMGGTLSAHSDGAGRGATFTLELPFDTAQAER